MYQTRRGRGEGGGGGQIFTEEGAGGRLYGPLDNRGARLRKLFFSMLSASLLHKDMADPPLPFINEKIINLLRLQRFQILLHVNTGKRCNQPLGMQNGRIKPHQLSASSSWDKNHGPSNGRLQFRRRGSLAGAWCARHNTRYQWLQVYFGRAMRVVKIATQGRQDYRQWVTQYYLSYSQDGAHFAEFKINSNRKVSDIVLLVIQNLSFRQVLVLRFGSARKKGIRSRIRKKEK